VVGDLWVTRDTADAHIWEPDPDNAGQFFWTDIPLATGEMNLDSLTDVDVSLAATGMMLTKQIDGTWKGANFSRPLNWLSDVATGTIDADGNPVPADQTPAGHILGTSAPGFWEPLSLAYVEEQIVTPLQQQIGDPATVAAHTDLVGYIGEVADRVGAIEGSGEPPVADTHLFVDNYGGGFIRNMPGPTATAVIDIALATTAGPGGALYPTLGDIPGQAAVWVDFGGSLGHVKTATGTDVLGATLKEWIRKGAVLNVHKDSTTDPAHPSLVVDSIAVPTPAGSSLALGDLKNVTASPTPADALNPLRVKADGTGFELGQYGYLDRDLDETLLAYDNAKAYSAGEMIVQDGILWYAPIPINAGEGAPRNGRYRDWLPVTGFDLATNLYPLAPTLPLWGFMFDDPNGGQLGLPTEWDASKTYSPGHMVFHSNKLWHANAASLNVTPSDSAAEWDYVSLVDLVQKSSGGGSDPSWGAYADGPTIAEWDAATAYLAANKTIVSHNDALWLCVGDAAAGIEPGTSAIRWRPISLLHTLSDRPVEGIADPLPWNSATVYEAFDRCTNEGVTWVARVPGPGSVLGIPRRGDVNTWGMWFPVEGGDIGKMTTRLWTAMEMLWSMWNGSGAKMQTGSSLMPEFYKAGQTYSPGNVVWDNEEKYLWIAVARTTGPPPEGPWVESAEWKNLSFYDYGGGVKMLLDVMLPGRTPDNAGKLLAINADATAFEMVDAPSGGGSGLPEVPPSESGTWTFRGTGITTAAGEIKVDTPMAVTSLRVNAVDSTGHNWQAKLLALWTGDKITVRKQGGSAVTLTMTGGGSNSGGTISLPVNGVNLGHLSNGDTITFSFPPPPGTPTDGDVLTLVDGAGAWRTPAPAVGGATTLDALTDVDVHAAVTGQLLGKTATGWGPVDAPHGGSAVDLSNYIEYQFDITDPTMLYSNTKHYFPGNIAVFGGKVYTSDIEQTGGNPPSTQQTWSLVGAQGQTLGQQAVATAAAIVGAPSIPSWWEAQSYAAFTVVQHLSKVWLATAPTIASEVPGTSPKWREITLNALDRRVAALEGTGPDAAWKKWTGTQAQYDAIPVKDADTLYVITAF
jgi:hypothetical protein